MYELNIQSENELKEYFKELHVDPGGILIMAPKGKFRVIRINDLSAQAANILKQDLLSNGGEVALPWDSYDLKKRGDAIVMATEDQLIKLKRKLLGQPFQSLKEIAKQLDRILKKPERTIWNLRGQELDFSKPLIMGILNITPDSFSDGGKYFDVEEAVKHARRMVKDGASIIDVGGESTRPGAKPVSEREELKRVLPLVEMLASEIKIPISIDTAKPHVAEQCLKSGAHIVNDVTGLNEIAMRRVIAKNDAGCIIMHMQGKPRTMQKNPSYLNVVDDIHRFLEARVELAQQDGITKIMVDPGFGFGKTLEHNLALLRNLKAFTSIGCPVVVGVSRKSFIKMVSGIDEPEARYVGTIVSHAVALQHGAGVLRVHDVKEARETIEMVKAIHP